MSSATKDKSILRKKILARRLAIAPDQAMSNCLAVTALINNIPCWGSAVEVLVYWPIKNELDTRPLIFELWRRRVKVLLPRCHQPGMVELAAVTCEADLVTGWLSVMEPSPCCVVINDTVPDLVLVPGVAFDRRGSRLGFGGGYYDRILALPNLSHALKIGLAYSFQVFDKLPNESWDLPIDVLCTEKELLWFI